MDWWRARKEGRFQMIQNLSVNDILLSQLHPSWLTKTRCAFENTYPRYQSADQEHREGLVLEHFLCADARHSLRGLIPDLSVRRVPFFLYTREISFRMVVMRKRAQHEMTWSSFTQGVSMLHGTFVLQLDEVFDISRPVRDRYKQTNGKNRLLKLVLYDGMYDFGWLAVYKLKDI